MVLSDILYLDIGYCLLAGREAVLLCNLIYWGIEYLVLCCVSSFECYVLSTGNGHILPNIVITYIYIFTVAELTHGHFVVHCERIASWTMQGRLPSNIMIRL